MNQFNVKSIVSPNNFIMVSIGDETYQITRDNPVFSQVEVLIRQKKWDLVFNILGKAKTISVYTEGNISIEDGEILYKGQVVHNYVATKIAKMIEEGSSDFKPLARFLDKLMENKFAHVRENLYKFLEYGELPITPEGDFIGYKKVRADYKDVHSGAFDNSPGKTCKMDISNVVSDPYQGCSSGLHVGTKQYVFGFSGQKIVLVKVDPRNVVSVPLDYSFQKMRCCEYTVVADYIPDAPLVAEVYNVVPAENKVEKYVSKDIPNVRRGPDGRFIKKTVQKQVSSGPKRDANGRFIKKTLSKSASAKTPVHSNDVDWSDEFNSW